VGICCCQASEPVRRLAGARWADGDPLGWGAVEGDVQGGAGGCSEDVEARALERHRRRCARVEHVECPVVVREAHLLELCRTAVPNNRCSVVHLVRTPSMPLDRYDGKVVPAVLVEAGRQGNPARHDRVGRRVGPGRQLVAVDRRRELVLLRLQ
jgi:hypothetical protein